MATSKVAPGFRYLGGSKRQYQNIATGEVLSRHAYDVRYGYLKEAGARSYREKAARVPEEQRKSRPAPGRVAKGRIPAHPERLQPLKGKRARRVNAGRTAAQYDKVLGGLKRNKKIDSVEPIIVFVVEGTTTEKYVWPDLARAPDQTISGDEIEQALEDYIENYGDVLVFQNFVLHITYKSDAFRPLSEGVVNQRSEKKRKAKNKRERARYKKGKKK